MPCTHASSLCASTKSCTMHLHKRLGGRLLRTTMNLPDFQPQTVGDAVQWMFTRQFTGLVGSIIRPTGSAHKVSVFLKCHIHSELSTAHIPEATKFSYIFELKQVLAISQQCGTAHCQRKLRNQGLPYTCLLMHGL